MIDIPDSMKDELGAWNNGAGISIDQWIGCEGRFSLAVGYAAVFWPGFVEFEGYVLEKGFSIEGLRSFEASGENTRQSIEWVMNHVHIADLQHEGCSDISRDKIILLGEMMREMYTAKLQWQFPNRRFVVEFARPENPDDLQDYQISFWQE